MKDMIIPIPSVHIVKNTFKIITIPIVHMVKNTLKFTNTWNNHLTKTNNMLKIQKNKDTNQTFNDVEFPK